MVPVKFVFITSLAISSGVLPVSYVSDIAVDIYNKFTCIVHQDINFSIQMFDPTHKNINALF